MTNETTEAAHGMNGRPKRIRVHVLFFGAARDAAGHSETDIELEGVATAATAFNQVLDQFPALRRFGRSLLFAVNQEYAGADSAVRDGDELALFPPVSGGSQGTMSAEKRNRDDGASKDSQAIQLENVNETERDVVANGVEASSHDFFELTTEPIDIGSVARRVVLAECGATVTLDGYAREWTRGRRTLYLVYEAYAPMAVSELERLGREANKRFEIAHIGIVHRTGRLEIGETSVVISVSAPHRRAAFEACEWAIRELKRTVPIWKKEVYEDGEVWVEGESGKPPAPTSRA